MFLAAFVWENANSTTPCQWACVAEAWGACCTPTPPELRKPPIFHITLPLALPGIIVTSMFAFVFSWNNAIFPLVLSKQSTAPLPIGTLNYFAIAGVTWNYIAATAVVAMLPPMIIFLVLGRYIVRGLTFGAIKG